MVRGDHVVAQPLAQLVREAFGQSPRVHEHERGAVLEHERRDAVEHVRHLLRARDRFELALRQFDREVERRWWPLSTIAGRGPIADEQPGDGLDRSLRSRESETVRSRIAEYLEPLVA